ncbi:MAG: DUF445 family protein [Leptospiraceae bacterium]|nr:DUF445 family protein [Leptospiraceae bacterium]
MEAEKKVQKKPPYRKKKIISNTLLLLSLSGLGLTNYYRLLLPPLLFTCLNHGFEGGLVGGFCDWFAVWKTYHAIEEDSEKLATEIGEWVSSDLLSQETLRAQVRTLLDDPASQKQFIALLDSYFSDEEAIRKKLDSLWNRIEDPLIHYLSTYHPSQGELSLLKGTFNEKEIMKTFKYCLGEALCKLAGTEKIKPLLIDLGKSKNFLVKLILSMYSSDINDIIKSYGKHLMNEESFSPKEEKLDDAFQLFAFSLQEAISSWDNLPDERKLSTIRLLNTKLKEPLLHSLSGFLASHKEQLEKSRTLRAYLPVKIVLEFLEERVEPDISVFIGKKISERLKSQDPRDFRNRMEWKTRKILESIRINGTLLGFALGAAFGLLGEILLK